MINPFLVKDVPRYTCECGSKIRVSSYFAHEKTKKHLSYLAKINEKN